MVVSGWEGGKGRRGRGEGVERDGRKELLLKSISKHPDRSKVLQTDPSQFTFIAP
jgi:hypothetical protein